MKSSFAVAAAVCLASVTAPCGAQCPGEGWLPGEGFPGVDKRIYCSCLWDPDGPGPRNPVLVVGGAFNYAGATRVSNIAILDGAVWSTLGSGINGTVAAVAALPTGELVAAGLFTEAGGVPVANVAAWNGTNWSPLGAGTDSGVAALAILDSLLVAGGSFTHAGGIEASKVAAWDGQSWSPLGAGLSGVGVSALSAMSNGDLVAAGQFDSSAGQPMKNIARWDGQSWSSMGDSGIPRVYAAIEMPGGDVVAGGDNYFKRWNGSAWTTMGTYFAGTGQALALSPDLELFAGGLIISVNNVIMRYVMRWDGAAWQPMASGLYGAGATSVYTLTFLPDGRLFVGGAFDRAWTGLDLASAALWDGTAWAPLWTGVPPATAPVRALAMSPNGDMVAGGEFTVAGGNSASHIALWNGSLWSPMGPGFSDTVLSTVVMPSGDVVAGGYFIRAGTLTVNRIARWNGTEWSKLGTGTNNSVYALLALPNGDLVAGGEFIRAGGVVGTAHVARWDGSAWKVMGSGLPAAVNALALRPNGEVFAAVDLTHDVYRWNGASWVSTSAALNSNIEALAALPNGDVVVGGSFTMSGSTTVNYIARWDGSSWVPMQGGMDQYVLALGTLPSGDLVAGGWFNRAGGTVADKVARWDGSAWHPYGRGLTKGFSGSTPWTRAIVGHPSGEVIVGGNIGEAADVPSSIIARWSDTGIPWISLQPRAQSRTAGEPAAFSAMAASGYEPVSYRWQRETAQAMFIDVADGPTAWGSTIAGATSSTLTISNVGPADSGRYRCIIANACGSANSDAAWLTICLADFTQDGFVTGDDFDAFSLDFEHGDPTADIDGNGFVTGDDFDQFTAAFETGC